MAKKKKILWKYYLLVLPILLFSILFLSLFKVSPFNIVFFVSSYSWQVLLRAPFVADRIFPRKFRFSFVRSLYLINEFFLKTIAPDRGRIRVAVARMSSPILFGAALMFFAKDGNILYLFLGSLLSEIVLWNGRARVVQDIQ